eukprot:CAMPEP_0196576424 /NCGR_PEP_ID=MMETSP1081-20130531/5681_1 /TAXON_ID=36882 /ORGANISM="Pyramimonas amylifera, Strain CCMP720" /LENGTH=241 /DNA_ID=CAMNT_0041895021 /DNA_START=189 /DNA_END=914 /DNA_ORIENTATION=+
MSNEASRMYGEGLWDSSHSEVIEQEYSSEECIGSPGSNHSELGDEDMRVVLDILSRSGDYNAIRKTLKEVLPEIILSEQVQKPGLLTSTADYEQDLKLLQSNKLTLEEELRSLGEKLDFQGAKMRAALDHLQEEQREQEEEEASPGSYEEDLEDIETRLEAASLGKPPRDESHCHASVNETKEKFTEKVSESNHPAAVEMRRLQKHLNTLKELQMQLAVNAHRVKQSIAVLSEEFTKENLK